MVDNQLRDNDPPSTKEAYQKLLDAGYSMREAKEKIGVVVLTEIYDVMKENQSYDDKRYTNALAVMVQDGIDIECICRSRRCKLWCFIQTPVSTSSLNQRTYTGKAVFQLPVNPVPVCIAFDILFRVKFVNTA